MTPQQKMDIFRLVEVQMKQGFELASQAAAGDYSEHTRPYVTVSHLVGICSYCNELLNQLKMEMEDGE